MVNSVESKKWQAQDDAYTLIRAGEIEADNKRKNAAKREVKAIVKSKEKELKAVKKIAGSVTKRRITRKSKKK